MVLREAGRFAQLARSNLDTPIKGALASIHLDRLAATPYDGEPRWLAEGAYHLNRPAIEAEQRRQTAAEAAGYRAGKRWTPTGPTWNLTVVRMTENIATRVRDVVEWVYRELAHLCERFDRTHSPQPRRTRTEVWPSLGARV